MIQICMRGLCVSSILLGLWLGFGSKSFDPATSSASAEAAATSATPKYKTVAIRDIQPAGYKVLAENPQTPWQAAGDFGEFDPETWRVHRFLMTKPNGGWLKIGLARPVAWIESVERNDSGQVWLEFEELGIAGWATLQGTESCPSDILGEGRLVTGTFEHSSGEVLNLFIAGEATPIGSTANHPFWSEDRQDFVQAGSLNPGEHLRLADDHTTTLERTEPIAEQLPVYNLEVDGEHVYFVGESGMLVHNAGSEYSLRGKHPNKVSQQLLDKNPSWKREPADKGHGWKLVDENGVDGTVTCTRTRTGSIRMKNRDTLFARMQTVIFWILTARYFQRTNSLKPSNTCIRHGYDTYPGRLLLFFHARTRRVIIAAISDASH